MLWPLFYPMIKAGSSRTFRTFSGKSLSERVEFSTLYRQSSDTGEKPTLRCEGGLCTVFDLPVHINSAGGQSLVLYPGTEPSSIFIVALGYY